MTDNPYQSPDDDSAIDTKPKDQPKPSAPNGNSKKLIVFGLIAVATVILLIASRKYLGLEYLSGVEANLKEYYAQHPIVVYAVAFLIYFLVTGLSIPGATVLSLVFAWFFGFTRGMVLISFASTAGATLAFLLSRYFFRDWIQTKFESRLKLFNEALERDGPFYLFTLRLVPIVPFFVINAVMGLTKIKVTTFWWVSQLGMLAGTAVYVYAGSLIPDLQTLHTEGVNAVFTPSQITQIGIAFTLLGVFPLVVKKVVDQITAKRKAAV